VRQSGQRRGAALWKTVLLEALQLKVLEGNQL
jgi:hypothetical protein